MGCLICCQPAMDVMLAFQHLLLIDELYVIKGKLMDLFLLWKIITTDKLSKTWN